MQNIATIYRFNTPFLDFNKEKDGLLSIQEKIKDFTNNFEGIELIQKEKDVGEYKNVILNSKDNLIKFNFYYLNLYNGNYYAPVFKMDIFVDREKLTNNIIVGFLINIFECFDGLEENEYLIDLDNSLYYRNKFFGRVFPNHDFTDIDTIKEEFEKNKGVEILEIFIKKFSNKDYKLDIENAREYYKIHSIVLYYIYLVYMLYQSIVDSKNELDYLENVDLGEQNPQKVLMQERLKHINDLSLKNFKSYYEKLELFFNLFK